MSVANVLIGRHRAAVDGVRVLAPCGLCRAPDRPRRPAAPPRPLRAWARPTTAAYTCVGFAFATSRPPASSQGTNGGADVDALGLWRHTTAPPHRSASSTSLSVSLRAPVPPTPTKGPIDTASLRRQSATEPTHRPVDPLSPTLLTLMTWTSSTPAPTMRSSNITSLRRRIAADPLRHAHAALVRPVDALPPR